MNGEAGRDPVTGRRAEPIGVLDVIGTACRFGLAAVWLVSGWVKVVDPAQTVAAVRAYDLVPAGLISRGRVA
jgi:uncharacterized membrane protein YphA (DoxX/SURF4 family)